MALSSRDRDGALQLLARIPLRLAWILAEPRRLLMNSSTAASCGGVLRCLILCSPTRSRLYLQCRPDEDILELARRPCIWEELQ